MNMSELENLHKKIKESMILLNKKYEAETMGRTKNPFDDLERETIKVERSSPLRKSKDKVKSPAFAEEKEVKNVFDDTNEITVFDLEEMIRIEANLK